MIKKTAFALFFLMLIAAASSVGFYFGIKQGVEQQVFLTAPTEGVQRVKLLRMLREGKADEVVRLVEGQLDYFILYHWDSLHSGREYFLNEEMRIMKENMPRQMATIAEYKTQFPPNNTITLREEIPPEIGNDLKRREEKYSDDLKKAILYYKNLGT